MKDFIRKSEFLSHRLSGRLAYEDAVNLNSVRNFTYISRFFHVSCMNDLYIRVRPRFFDQVGHETMYASVGTKHFFTKSCHCQTYQNYEQSRQKLGTILGNKVS